MTAWLGGVLSLLSVGQTLRLSSLTILAVVVLVIIAAGASLRMCHSALLGLSSWAFYTGFVVNGFGVLSFRPSDLRGLALLLAASGAAHLLP